MNALALFLLASLISMPVRALDYGFSGGCETEMGVFSTAEGGCKDEISGVVWGPIMTKPVNFEQAKRYCAGFENGIWGKWKLPRLKDLQDLERRGVVHKGLFRSRAIHHFFWVGDFGSETTHRTATLAGDFNNDVESNETAHVICIRQGLPSHLGCKTAETDYFVSAKGGCLYKSSGKVYSQLSEHILTQPMAQKYCNDLVEGQEQDWRLPSKEELTIIAWKGGADAHFKFSVYGDFWSSSLFTTTDESLLVGRTNEPLRISRVEQQVSWVNLGTGHVGGAPFYQSTTPYSRNGAKVPTYGFFATLYTSGEIDISHLRTTAICIRP